MVNSSQSPELLQAQFAAFTFETVSQDIERFRLYRAIGNIAAAGPDEIFGLVDSDVFQTYLQDVGGLEYDGISVRARYLEEYANYEAQVAEARADLSGEERRHHLDRLLAPGFAVDVFRVARGEDEYAARVPNSEFGRIISLDDYIGGAIAARNNPALEHMVAASYHHGATVSEIIPGKTLDSLDLHGFTYVSDAHLDGLVDALVQGNGDGVDFDTNPKNILFDDRVGFGIVDFTSTKNARLQNKQFLWSLLSWTGNSLMTSINAPINSEQSKIDEEKRLRRDILHRYKDAVRRGIPHDPDLHMAISTLDMHLTRGT